MRALAFTDIDACLYVILEDSLAYLHTKNEVIDPMTEQTYLYYKNSGRGNAHGTIEVNGKISL